MTNLQKFCVIPFIQGYSDTSQTFGLCCEFKQEIPGDDFQEVWNGKVYQEYRQSFLNGKIPNGCDTCILDEKDGVISHRQISNQQYYDDAIKFYQQQKTKVDPPKIFDFRYTHYCNLECVMCNTGNSTAIEKRVFEYPEKQKLENVFKARIKTVDESTNKKTLDFIYKNISTITELHFAGGEPFIMHDVKQLLEYCVEQGVAENISIRITTNCTVVRTTWFQNFLLKFKKIDLLCSVDGTGEILEYIRYPSRWSVIERNLKFFKQLSLDNDNFEYRIELCLHALNFKNLKSIVDYCGKNKHNISFSFVYGIGSFGSKILNIDILDQEYREQVVQDIDFQKLNDVETNIYTGFLDTIKNKPQRQLTPSEKTDLTETVKYWDSHRTVKFHELYPELTHLIHNGENNG